MPSVEIEKPAAAAPGRAWAFISDIDNWAPLLTGYQSHRKIDDRHSRWTVRGELAGLSRVSEFEVTITDWVDNVRIGFTLEGLDEPFSGSGAFHIASAESSAAPVVGGWFVRLRARLIRQVLFMVTGRGWRPGSEMTGPPAAVQSVLSCRLEILAGGGSGPIMNLLLGPILEAVAKDTAVRIVAALEAAGT